jgi:hypothetical protein
MHRPWGLAKRSMVVVALALSLALIGIGPVAAYTPPNEVQTGQIAHYYIRDLTTTPIVTCNYVLLTDHYRISSFVVKIPYVWWYNTNSGNTKEHGKVGWQVRIQSATDPDGTWTTVYTSSTEKQTAYEDNPGYDSNDRAHFAKRTISWGTNQNVVYRVKLILSWYKSDGSTKGTLTHWYQEYDGYSGPTANFCSNQIF